MGFSQQKATKALIETDNNVARACEWIFSHIEDDDDPMDEIKPDAFTDGSSSKSSARFIQFADPLVSEYRLRAFITHMGSSATVGHYVCHIKQEDQWVIFNDSKVALSVNPPKELAYLYLYERITA